MHCTFVSAISVVICTLSLVHLGLQPTQLTGRCDCLPNVGSDMDDKCCNCTPGFFGFSPVEGCQGEHW